MWKKITSPILLGVGTSVFGSYAYTWLTLKELPLWWIALAAVVTVVVISVYFALRRPLSIATFSGILNYYPAGQAAYKADLLADAKKSHRWLVVGARGRDLIGEESTLGQLLQNLTEQIAVEVFLIHPDSSHIRVRINSLNAEKSKYLRERDVVDAFLEVLAGRNGVRIERYSYLSSPVFRAIILDSVAYVSIYEDGVRGRDLPCFRIAKSQGPLWRGLERYLVQLRRDASNLSMTNQA